MNNEINQKALTLSFEDFKKENGMTYWWASDLLRMLGYKDLKSFQGAIDRAIKACLTLKISHDSNFLTEYRGENKIKDYKLTRFACYLTVMNADPKKPEVAKAQVYFAEQTRKFELYLESTEEFDRLLVRDELKEGNKALFSVAQKAGIEDFAKFNNAGYLGLYNMFNVTLAKKRNIDSKELFEYMGRTELAANLFRTTQTEERIKNQRITGQENLENTHKEVGAEIRDMMKKNTGVNPEDLPIERKIHDVQKEIKQGYRKMLKEDNTKKKKKT